MITPSFGLTAIERVLPRLALDFTTASLDARVAFTRADATATVVNSSGNVVVVAADTPRFDYDPLTLVCKGLLIEESRQNTFLYSEDFSNAWWLKTGLLAFGSGSTVDATVSPDGTQDADLLTEDTSAGTHQLATNLGFNFLAGTYYTQSFFIKPNGRTKFQTSYRSNWFGGTSVNFDLVAKTASVLAGSSATTSGGVQEYKNGWFRIWHTAQATVTGSSPSDTFFYFADATGATNYTGDGTSGAYVWGAQLEAGAFPTSYIPTTTTSLTRNADVATMTGTNFSDWWMPGKGSILVNSSQRTVSGTRPWLQFDDTTADNIIALRGNTTNPELYIKATTDQAQIDAGTIAANTSYRFAASWATNACAASINSGAPVLDGSATIPVVTQARLGSNGVNYLNGWLEQILYFDYAITSSNLQLTSSQSRLSNVFGPVIRDKLI